MTKPHNRKDQRVDTPLLVYLDNARGVTRDMSASGAFFWAGREYAVGESINFAIELKTAGGRMMWKCRGDVLRTEPRDYMSGIAVKITESTMEPV